MMREAPKKNFRTFSLLTKFIKKDMDHEDAGVN